MKRLQMIIGLLLLLTGIAGFFSGTILKKAFLVPELGKMSGKRGEFEVAFGVQPPDVYRVFVWIEGEKGQSQPGSASAMCDLSIQLDDDTLTSETLVGTSTETGGVKRAAIGKEITAIPRQPGKLHIAGNLTEGDRWSLEVYRNQPDALNLLPGLSILLALAGGIMMVRGRGR